MHTKNWKVSAVAAVLLCCLIAITVIAAEDTQTESPVTQSSDVIVSTPDNSEPLVSQESSEESFEEPSTAPSEPEASVPEESVTEESTESSSEPDEIIIPDISAPEEKPLPPSKNPDTIGPDEIILPLPDTLEVEIKFYNFESDSFNLHDGAIYCADIAALLKKYAPEGLHISAGVAMAYTEGGAGKAGVYTRTNNCFGIRAYSNWDGYVYSRTTGTIYKDWETAYRYGDVDDTFRAYDCMEDSVKDYCSLISGERYNHCFTMESNQEYLEYILSQGYGEPHLASTWMYLIDLYNLEQYDV